MKPLVLGFGNSLRGDDGAGPFTARLLQSTNVEDAWDVVACHQLTPELAETISRASVVIFVDADSTLPAGEARARRLEEDSKGAAPLVHKFDAPGLLRWSLELYGTAPKAWVVGIGPESFDLGDSLSPAAESGAHKAAELVREILTL